MEIVENKADKKRDVAIEMSHIWSSDYSKNINEIKNINLNGIRLKLKAENYLSPHADTLHHLLYLSTIRKKNREKTPFTQKQQSKFDTAFTVKRSVPWSFFVNGVVIGVTAMIPFTNFVSLVQCSNTTQSYCLAQTSAITIPTITSVVGALAVGFVSLYATGLSPDLSSRKANKVQDEIVHLSRKYATVAKYWIDIYFENQKQAEHIAEKFDIEELKLRAQQKTYKAKLGNSLVSPLEEAWHYIKYKTILITFTDIENYIYNKINCKQIEDLRTSHELFEKRIELLEKMVHTKDEEIEALKCEK